MSYIIQNEKNKKYENVRPNFIFFYMFPKLDSIQILRITEFKEVFFIII